jgi:hypothetical protein
MGFCLIANPPKFFSVPHHSFFNDLLVWEILCEGRKWLSEDLNERIVSGATKTLVNLRGNGKRITHGDVSIEMFSYFFPIDAKTHRNRLFRWFVRIMDVAVPDNDTTCVIFPAICRVSSALNCNVIQDWQKDWAAFILFLREHLHNKGKYGQGPLSYENGSRDEDFGIATWIFDECNEVDPTVNTNVLGFLVTVFPRVDSELQIQAQEIAHVIFEFLFRHASTKNLTSQRFQQYYPMGMALFCWYRFSHIWRGSSFELRRQLDPLNRFQGIHDC